MAVRYLHGGTDMIAALARYKLVAEGLVVLALFAAVLYGFHRFCEHQRDIGRAEIQEQWDKKEAADKLHAAELSIERQKNVNAAIAEGIKRGQTNQTAAAGANAAATGLRDAIAAFQRSLPTATAEAAIDRAITASTLLGECTERYRGVAEKADRHANDAATLEAAWPTR